MFVKNGRNSTNELSYSRLQSRMSVLKVSTELSSIKFENTTNKSKSRMSQWYLDYSDYHCVRFLLRLFTSS